MAKPFAQQLQTWRQRLGWSQETAAIWFRGMPIGTYRRYEQGSREPAPWVQAYIQQDMIKNPPTQQK